jgi:ATP-binding cassette subfamily C protein CydD
VLLSWLPSAWWTRQLSWQLLEALGRLGFLLALALIASSLLTDQEVTISLWLVAVISLALRYVGQQGQNQHATEASQQALAQLHHRASHGAMNPLHYQHDIDAGARAMVLGQQLQRMAPYWQAFLPALLAAAWQPLLVLTLVTSADWLAGLLLLFTMPLIPGFAILIGLGSAHVARQEHGRLQRLGSLFFDRLSALTQIRLMNASASTREQLRQGAESLKDSTLRVLRIAFLSSATLEFFAAVSIAALAMYVGLALLNAIEWGPAPYMTLREGLLVLLLAPEFFAPLRTLAQRYHERTDARSAAIEPLELASRDAAPAQAHRDIKAPAVSLQQLTVHWPNRPTPVLRQLNLEVPAGSWVTITGASGSGKSTLANVLAGHLAWQGSFLLDQQAVQRETLRGRVAWLDQTPALLNASLQRNLAPGVETPDPIRMAEVLRMTGLSELAAALPHGWTTRLGASGAALSGGQAQRMALARALYPGARLLVLDEPTAQLDATAEQALLDVLRSLSGSHTIVLFAHSEAAAAAADRQVAMEDLHGT